MADRKSRFSTLSYFEKQYKTNRGKPIVFNKYAAQWDADALVESYGESPLRAMIDRYFAHSESPSWKGFARDAQKIWEAMAMEALDQDNRKIIKQRAREWMNE